MARARRLPGVRCRHHLPRSHVPWVATGALAMAALIACEGTTGPGPPVSAGVVPAVVYMGETESRQLSLVLLDSAGNSTLVVDRPVAWYSPDTLTATVSDSGVVTGKAAGPATILAAADGFAASGEVNVTVRFVQVDAGAQTCGISDRGRTYCWGAEPAAVRDLPPIVTVRAGGGIYRYDNACGLDSSGAAYCWGDNGYGQLGDGTTEPNEGAVPVTGGLILAKISPGGEHTCAITVEGDAYCWGFNNYGKLGIGSWGRTSYSTPQPVAGGLKFADISSAEHHTCGVATDGVGYCWGRPDRGRTGDGDPDESSGRVTPTAVAGGLRFSTISAGPSTSCGITTEGDAYCWGIGWFGALGAVIDSRCPSGVDNCTNVPVPVSGGYKFQALSSGGSTYEGHTCGLTTFGLAVCWGANGYGQRGDGSTANSAAATRIAGGLSFASVTTGWFHSCGLTTDGVTYCWGSGFGVTPQPVPYQP